MKTLKLAVHSFIDVITNSSTETFINYTHCLQPCKDMINEMLKAFNSTLECDDIFEVTLENDDYGDEGVDMIRITAKDSKYEAIADAIMRMLENVNTKDIMC